ncbi:MAG: hypothetical protein ABI461_11560, partial [Polyangiaceae bacterium]
AILSTAMGCSKIFSYAVDRAMGDDASITEALTSSSGSGSGSGKDVCDLVTDAEIEAASGKKIVHKDNGGEDSCGWALSATGKEDQASMANIKLQILPELSMKIIPILGKQTSIPGIGDKAEWSGGAAPNLRVHVKGGKVLNFMFVDLQAMMKNPGITEKEIGGNNTRIDMDYPELEKEAIALGKAAVGRY